MFFHHFYYPPNLLENSIFLAIDL